MSNNKSRIEKIAEMSNSQLTRLHSKNQLENEAIHDEAIARLEEIAGDNRTDEEAQNLAEMRALAYDYRAHHSRMDALAARVLGVPVARSGER